MNKSVHIDSTTSGMNSSETVGTLDSSKLQAAPSAGVILGEQQQVQSVLPNEMSLTKVNTRATSHMPDAAWDLQAMLKRRNLVDTFTWDGTSAPGVTLRSYNVIQDLLKLAINQTPFERFRYWRCSKIRIHMQITAYRYLAGRLIAGFVPFMGAKSPIDYSRGRLVQVQHAFLDPSAASVVEMEIPFNYFKGWVDLSKSDTLGIFYIKVFNGLAAGVGTPPKCNVKVFVDIEDSEFKVPIPSGPSSGFSSLKIERQSLLGALDSGFKELTESIMPSNIIGDIFGAILDKPEEPEQPAPIMNKDQQYLSNNRGAEYLEKQTLDPSAQQVVDFEHFMTTQDEMSIDYLLKKKKSYIRTVQWSQSQSVGTILWSERVGPLLNFLFDVSQSVNTRIVDYIAMNFMYWRGALKYIFDVVGTQFHEGRLDIQFFPAANSQEPDYLKASSVYLGSIVIRNGENSFSFEAPFLSTTPYRMVYHGGQLGDGPNDLAIQQYSNGFIQLVVGSELLAPENVPPNVEINVFQSAGSDFELNMPSMYNHSLAIADTPGKVRIQRQSGQNDMPNLNNTADNIDSLKLSAVPTTTSDPQTSHFGERYDSLRELAKRYNPCNTSIVDISGLDAPILADINNGNRPLIIKLRGRDLINTSYIRRLTAIYRTVRGSMRFKLRARIVGPNNQTINNNLRGFVSYFPAVSEESPTINQLQGLADLYIDDPTGNPSIPHTLFSTTQTAEFEIPFMSYSAVQKIFDEYDIVNTQNYAEFFDPSLLIALYPSDKIDVTTNIVLEVYAAFGDHTRFGTFLGCPDLSPIGSVTTGSPYPDLWIPRPAVMPKTRVQRNDYVFV